MAGVSLSDVKKRFGAAEVIHGVDLTVEDGEFVVFVGPSGCGKSTLLRMIAGLEDISGGEVRIGERVVNDVEASDRGTAMVFQTYALYPHMTVAQNMSFGLRMTGNDKADTEARVSRAAEVLQIEPLMDRRPKALSGGQRQRVAIGRAIVRDPSVFLFDEPLSNLDAELRVQMRVEIARLHGELGTTMIYVTHDQTEAMTLADRIVVLRAGRVEQVGRPLELYHDPANQFVAGFIGSPRMNFLPGTVVSRGDGRVRLRLERGGEIELPLETLPREGAAVTLGIRPEHFVPAGQGDCDITLEVEVIEHLGATSFVYSGTRSGAQIIAQRPETPESAEASEHAGERLTVAIPAARAFLFDDSGARLR
ncbi:ABC transporter ATP-binding protein [Pseudoroseicyclus aestuarii]|uniref:Carbohydrate ABC transporter ATP-binding protein (CUT1 family) n=1 Tax=Pseudoroseicyclus aestuarii TaxID=1795041 RepID=A0A318SP42_9RHOB|nr:sn-glycerol-3-phosphate ABC transporter ATP-binding protein UgpC [Pseudoroseicyclus aestuarii]PYE83651.1 carbohydrate ABC transporter ATP-binding protein (CUT1 family) [Pseudoroseicyclus aestuarii]